MFKVILPALLTMLLTAFGFGQGLVNEDSYSISKALIHGLPRKDDQGLDWDAFYSGPDVVLKLFFIDGTQVAESPVVKDWDFRSDILEVKLPLTPLRSDGSKYLIRIYDRDVSSDDLMDESDVFACDVPPGATILRVHLTKGGNVDLPLVNGGPE